MNVTALAAATFAVGVVGVIAFQVALALGVPWGAYAMGGASPGRFPARLRIAAIVQAGLLALMALIVLSRAGLVLAGWSEVARWMIWPVVALTIVAVVLNAITPSAAERRIWLPVTVVMLASVLVVALTAT